MIHPSAVIHPQAKIASDVKIGPFCHIGPEVSIGQGTTLHSHVVIDGHTQIGESNQIFPFCSIGLAPQDFTYKEEETGVVIGDHNIFRENVTIHKATVKESGWTRIGNHNFLMAYAHVGHDVHMDDHCLMINSSSLGGHVRIQSHVTLSGFSACAKFVRIGEGAYIVGASGVDRDILPYTIGSGFRAKLKGVNVIGLKRLKAPKKEILQLVKLFEQIENNGLSPHRFFQEENDQREGFLESQFAKNWQKFCLESKLGIAQMERENATV